MKTESTLLSLSIYLTNLCNLNCQHCFLRASPNGKNHLSWKQIKTILDYYRQQNYQIVEFTGGEACLSPHIRHAVTYARSIGFPSIGINSNGIIPKVVEIFQPDELDKITFSLDGVTPETNDSIRGQGSFVKTISTIKKSLAKKFNVEVIFTVNRHNLHQVKKIITFLDKLGVSKLSFNYVSPLGNAKDHSQILISPEDWVKIRQKIEKITPPKNLTIRFPLMFATAQEFKNMLTHGYQCILPNSTKTEVRPDGQIYHCCLTVENPDIPGGYIKNQQIVLEKERVINFLKNNYQHGCPARIPSANSKLIPICVYYKKIIEPTTDSA